MRDLFQQDDGGWLQDPGLLDRLVTEKLQAEAENLRAEGWKWIAIATDFPYGHTAGLRRLVGETEEITAEETASYEALRVEYEALEAQYSGPDDLPEDVDQRLGEIETAMTAFENRPVRFDLAEIARAGIFVSIDSDGSLRIERGFVRPEDEAPVEPGSNGTDDAPEPVTPQIPVQRAVITVGGAPASVEPEPPEEDDTIRPLSDRLVTELTAQKRSQRDQDGSEIRSVELERLTAEGQTLIERRNGMEFFRDQAADQFERHTSSTWRPRAGSMVNHRTLTSAMIDSRDFLAAKRRAETEVLVPAGPKIAVTGGLDFNDHRLIWDRLDRVHAKHPDMVLLHGGSPKGAERIAARWADHRKVPQIAFKPDWTRHAKAAPFKRNDAMLDVLPIGVMLFPGSGIQENFADKARKLGIPVWPVGSGGA